MRRSNRRRRGRAPWGDDGRFELTPMIDIVFQLLIFFVLTAVFVQVEMEFASALPREGGLETIDVEIPLAPIELSLEWEGPPETGRCIAGTTNFQDASGASKAQHVFAIIEARTDPTADATSSDHVAYAHPDFDAIEAYLRYRRDRLEGADEPTVTVRFTPEVPVQMVVSLLNACSRAGIRDFGMAY